MKRAYILIVSAIVLFSCLKEKTVEPAPIVEFPCGDTVYFASQIQTNIIDLSCNISGCHDASASGILVLTTHATIADNANKIYGSINHESGFHPMPFGQPKLNDTLIQQFKCWLDQGKLNN